MYYPLLKHNNNEIKALNNLKKSSIPRLIPIIESKKIDPNQKNKWESKFNTLGKYLSRKINEFKFIYDFNTALEDLKSEDEILNDKKDNLVSYCVSRLKESKLDFIPCFHHDSPNWMTNSILERDFNEIAIRVRCHDFKQPLDKLIAESLISLLKKAKKKSKLTLILDFYNQSTSQDRIQNAINEFSKIPHANLIYLATACPEDASKAKAHNINQICAREELKMFFKLKKTNKQLFFGDYTTRLKGKIINGFNNDNSYIKIFYSSEKYYYIIKSKMIKNEGEETFYQVCQELIKQPFYPGENFSYGDKEIKKCADKKITISGHQTPIAIGINHHIETTIMQLN